MRSEVRVLYRPPYTRWSETSGRKCRHIRVGGYTPGTQAEYAEIDGEIDATPVGAMPDTLDPRRLRPLRCGRISGVGAGGLEELPGRRSSDVDVLVLEVLRSRLSKRPCRRGDTTATRMSASACLDFRIGSAMCEFAVVTMAADTGHFVSVRWAR